jgi:O-antigen/teichoic acid export membrane protein
VTDTGSRAIAWAGVVNLVGGATGSVIGLLLAAVVGRHLGADGAGTYFLVVALFMIVSNIAELGADTGLVRYLSAARATGRLQDVPHLVSIAVRPVLVVGAVGVAATAVAVLLWPDAVRGAPPWLVVVGTTLAVLSSMIAVMLAVARGLGDVLSYPLLQNIVLPLVRLGAVVGVVVVGGGTTAVLTAWMAPVPVVLLLATVVALALTWRQATGARTAPATDRRRLRRDFWTFSAARGASGAVEIMLEWFDVILVGALTSAEEAGIYAVVTRCARAGEVIQQAARIAVGPRISGALARGAVDEASDVYGLVTAAMIWLAWPFFIVLAVFSDVVLAAFGPDFTAGAVSLSVLSLAMGLATAAGTVQTILLMGGRSTWQLADKSAALALNIALDLLLVPVWGIEGAAVAWAVTILADTALVVHQVQHLMGVRPRGRHVGIAAAVSVGAVGTIAVASRLLLGSSVPVLIATVLVAAAAHVLVSIPLRHRLGLTALVARPAGV